MPSKKKKSKRKISQKRIQKKELKEITRITTIYDKILDYIRKNKNVKGNEIKKALNIPSKIFNKCIAVLEDAGLIEIEYPPVGDIKLKLKEGESSWLRR